MSKYHFKNNKKLRNSIKREEEDVDLSYNKAQDKSKWQVLVNVVMRHGFHTMYRIP